MTWPETNPAPSLARNDTACATSSGWPTRPTGILDAAACWKSPKSMPTLAAVAESGTRRQVDDPAELGLDHVFLARTAHQERAPQVHPEHRVPVVLGHLEQQVVADHPGVVDQHDGRAELGGYPRDGGLDLVGQADVGADGQRPAACRGDRLDGAAAVALLQVEHCDSHPVGGEAAGCGRADPSRSPGDNGDPLCFVWHLILLLAV